MTDTDALKSIELTNELGKLLTPYAPNVQLSAICQITGKFIAGHHPKLRKRIRHEIAVRTLKLISVYDDNITRSGRRPADWPPSPMRN